MGDSFPNTKLTDPEDEQATAKLMRFLETYIQRRDLLQKDVHKKQDTFRNILVELECENESLRYCNNEQKKMSYIREKDDKLKLVKQILTSTRESMSDDNAVLMAPIASSTRTEIAEESIPMMSKEKPAMVMSIDSQVPKSQQTLSSRTRINFRDDIQEKIAKEQIPMTSREESSSSQTEIAEESIRTTHTDSPSHSTTIALAEIATINKFKSDTKVKVVYLSRIQLKRLSKRIKTDLNMRTLMHFTTDKIPVVNPRYGRSQNADKWINHRPVGMVPTGTIFQPQIQPRKRIIRKLTNPNNFAVKSAKYCLYAQEQDTDGELETKLYKV
ncbi:kinesin-like protein kif23 protein [Lasius niger]|uniref:Kinesin-like protein kif23 protein n=1 Tax=Lasius niger TaxID=67767 RepID=A0A0J7KAF9_LASNI|nr:kinesin-like protein kif23 protein [Lasius niger]